MPSMTNSVPGPWLDLSEAARYLGVHFTTLRRWADAGAVPYIRTPGGRRRFALDDLQRFLEGLKQTTGPFMPAPLETRTLDVARQQLHAHPDQAASWQARFGEEERLKFRHSGQRMLGLLIQFGSRCEAGEAFLEEGKRLAADYGAACCGAGMSITEVVKTFLFFGHSMLNAVQQAGTLNGSHDTEALRLYKRMSDFLDAILLATIESYCRFSPSSATPSLEG